MVVGRPTAARFLRGWLARAKRFRKETRIAA
jgi:hypothetical protein